ncbi:MAG: hypothetical protein ACYSTT_22390, partial [Planctomycetota bacterium]
MTHIGKYEKYDEKDHKYYGAKKVVELEEQYFKKRKRTGKTGIALSGGGIRSASFSLGVFQALSHTGWLEKLDYVSTVSGGGYI